MPDVPPFTVHADRLRAHNLPFKETLGPAVKRARAHRLHALANGDVGEAAAAELKWRAQRAAWVELLALCHWPPDEADAEMASLEWACDAAVWTAMERRPGLSLVGLLDALGRS